jgi:hypothetical protein
MTALAEELEDLSSDTVEQRELLVTGAGCLPGELMGYGGSLGCRVGGLG